MTGDENEGFTLAELLIVAAIIAALVAISISDLQLTAGKEQAGGGYG